MSQRLGRPLVTARAPHEFSEIGNRRVVGVVTLSIVHSSLPPHRLPDALCIVSKYDIMFLLPSEVLRKGIGCVFVFT